VRSEPRFSAKGEVSSCVIGPHILPGRRVAKGDEPGYFQFGGSTHCLLFWPGVIADFAVEALPRTDDPHAPALLLGAKLALAN
jgi:phosphatidylserine decarboxylase